MERKGETGRGEGGREGEGGGRKGGRGQKIIQHNTHKMPGNVNNINGIEIMYLSVDQKILSAKCSIQ